MAAHRELRGGERGLGSPTTGGVSSAPHVVALPGPPPATSAVAWGGGAPGTFLAVALAKPPHLPRRTHVTADLRFLILVGAVGTPILLPDASRGSTTHFTSFPLPPPLSTNVTVFYLSPCGRPSFCTSRCSGTPLSAPGRPPRRHDAAAHSRRWRPRRRRACLCRRRPPAAVPVAGPRRPAEPAKSPPRHSGVGTPPPATAAHLAGGVPPHPPPPTGGSGGGQRAIDRQSQGGGCGRPTSGGHLPPSANPPRRGRARGIRGWPAVAWRRAVAVAAPPRAATPTAARLLRQRW